jgi:hypothetical protein
MTQDEVSRLCDALHEFLEQGVRGDTDVLREVLRILQILRDEATWDRPLRVLDSLEMKFVAWLSSPGLDEKTGVAQRQVLIENLGQLEDSWMRPVS